MLNAKSLIVLMTMPFALLLPLILLRERRPFMVHVRFSLHLYTFLLLLFCIALLAAKSSAHRRGARPDPSIEGAQPLLNSRSLPSDASRVNR